MSGTAHVRNFSLLLGLELLAPADKVSDFTLWSVLEGALQSKSSELIDAFDVDLRFLDFGLRSRGV